MFERKDIMIEDLRHIRKLLTENESGGQGRVNFLMTLTTAVAAGLVALKNDPNSILGHEVTISALIGLLAFSIVIYLRILRRDKQTDLYIAQAKALWNALVVEVKKTDGGSVHETEYQTKDPWWNAYIRGGYSQMVALIMGFIVAAIASVGVLTIQISGLLGLAVFVLAGVVPQHIRRRRRAESED